ncbi:unnamed protein product [Heligmosomoides polygyrus]|uniref:Transposase n=1 Tax=Heligmosomoides polygyrus TaxID=6339 RepID=A0A183G9H5_HELPZ|nr:unnamed protein product [Heligmosomoides polygyrus]
MPELPEDISRRKDGDAANATARQWKRYTGAGKVGNPYKEFADAFADKSHSQEKKCQLLRNRVAFLEHVLGQEGVTTDPDRIDKVG